MKGLQSYWPSNFENDSSLPGIEPGPNAIAHNSGGMAEAVDFFLRTPTLTLTYKSKILIIEISTLFSHSVLNFKVLAAF